MSDDIAISVRNVSKRYFVYENQRARLRHAFWPASTSGVSETWALRDVSFDVKKGEAVGIIGRNGSGKSTLLEIITETLQPSSGSVSVNGRVAALLELGSGFNPEYTGRENVFLNGLLMGLSRAEVDARFDEIAAFADIGEVLDRPVKTYSSGMLVRLAFAVQVALDPDILIVDEALSVGDYFFQQKCFGRLRQMREKGLTLLFVSHDMGTVRDLCRTAIYLKRGSLKYIGDSKTALHGYLAEMDTTSSELSMANVSSDPAGIPAPNLELADIKKIALWSVADGQEDGRRLLAVCLVGPDGQPTSHAKIGDSIKVRIVFRTPEGESGNISLIMKNRYDQIVSNVGSHRIGIPACTSNRALFSILEVELDLMLEAGLYSLMVSYGHPVAANRGNRIEETDWFGPLQISWDYEMEIAPFLGMFGVPARAKIINSESSHL